MLSLFYINLKTMERNVINIPYELAKGKKKNPLSLDLLCLSIAIKMRSGSSRYRLEGVSKFMQDFGISNFKTYQLIKTIKEGHPLFKFDEKNNTIIAKSYKRYRTITKDRNGNVIYQMYCMKMKIDGNFKLGYIKKELRKSLILCVVNMSERMDKFQTMSINNIPCRCDNGVFSLQFLANVAGVTRKSVVRLINELEEEHRLNVKKGELSEILEKFNRNDITKARLENKYIKVGKGGIGCVYYMTKYSIADRQVSEMFGNIIFNHKLRLTRNLSSNSKNVMEKECMSMFD